jgi:hypothetical protein
LDGGPQDRGAAPAPVIALAVIRGESPTIAKSIGTAGGTVRGQIRARQSTGGKIVCKCVEAGGVCATAHAGGKEEIWWLHSTPIYFIAYQFTSSYFIYMYNSTFCFFFLQKKNGSKSNVK